MGKPLTQGTVHLSALETCAASGYVGCSSQDPDSPASELLWLEHREAQVRIGLFEISSRAKRRPARQGVVP